MHTRIATERTITSHRKQTNGTESAWYCLRSHPKHERIAAAHVRLLENVKAFCPQIRFKRATRRGVVWVTEAMFPGYLFACFEFAKMHLQVRYAPGVSAIVRFAEQYPTIEEESLAQLWGHMGAAEVTELSYSLSEGDQVQIVGGAFVGLEAVVTQVLSTKERVKVLMDFLGRRTEAEIQCSSVLRQMAHPLAA
jgi:transcriptional antiterminator RfaH